MENTSLQDTVLGKLISDPDSIPKEMRNAVINNGGGHYNHSLFWKVMKKDGGGKPSDRLAEAIDKKFGSFDEFKNQFSQAASTRFGSGWAWLSVDSDGELIVSSTSNQDSPLVDRLTPILTLDIWEHAYYLKYQNKRPDYIEAWWNVVNWDEVGNNFERVKK